MPTPRHFVILIFTACLSIAAAAAQSDDCPAIVKAAIETVGDVCRNTGRNQTCYGNTLLEMTPADAANAPSFESPGDVVSVGAIQSLSLSALDADAGVWGISIMKIQANLPDTLPGQNITFVLFGDVEMTNAAPSNVEPITLPLTVKGNANVRSGPSTGDAIVGSLAGGAVVTATGRNADATWLLVELSEESGESAWVFADLVTVDGEAETLAVVDPAAPPPTDDTVTPQAFYLRTGAADPPCDEAPASGVLVQTPDAAESIRVVINDTDIWLGSTAFIQAQPDGEMTINMLEGHAAVNAGGAIRFAPAGTRTTVPLTGGSASQAPAPLDAYTDQLVNPLPVNLLEQAIDVAAPLSEAELAVLSDVPLISGDWYVSTFNRNTSCGELSVPENDLRIVYALDDGGATLIRIIDNDGVLNVKEWQRTEPGVYVLDNPEAPTIMEIQSPTHYTFDYTGECQQFAEYTLTAPLEGST